MCHYYRYIYIIHPYTCTCTKWYIVVASKIKELPTLYWLPKLHKSPYGSRFIAASNICTTKPLSRLLIGCLSLVVTQFREYCEGILVSGLSISLRLVPQYCRLMLIRLAPFVPSCHASLAYMYTWLMRVIRTYIHVHVRAHTLLHVRTYVHVRVINPHVPGPAPYVHLRFATRTRTYVHTCTRARSPERKKALHTGLGTVC